MMLSITIILTFYATFCGAFYASSTITNNRRIQFIVMENNVAKNLNDPFIRANRAVRTASAGDRVVELRQPLGLELDEDKEGNVFVTNIVPGGRAERSGLVFKGDYVAMCSATFGDDMWSCRGVGLNRVLTAIRVRNNKPVRLVLEAADEQEEKKRRAIAFAEQTEEQKLAEQKKRDELLKDLLEEDKDLLKKRKGPFGLW